MKSRISYMALWIAVLTAVPVMGQVMPLGKIKATGGVQKVSCSSCDAGQSVGGFYDGAIWGTSCGCSTCNVGPGLFPPCPNPCNTTLLGDVVCDVKGAVDNGLSHLFGTLFGAICLPCGCQSVCSCDMGGCDSGCTSGGCDTGCSAGCSSCNSGVSSGVSGDYTTVPTLSPTPAAPLQPTPATGPTPANPFVDDPVPSARLQPIPPRAARRISTAPRLSQQTARATVRPVSYEIAPSASVPAEATNVAPAQLQATVQDAQPLTQEQSGHYLPRRTTSLRQSNGTELKLAPLRATGAAPGEPA